RTVSALQPSHRYVSPRQAADDVIRCFAPVVGEVFLNPFRRVAENVHAGKSLSEFPHMFVIQFERKKHSVPADALENQPGESAGASAELDHRPGVPQITAAEHRLSPRRGTGHDGTD